MMTRHPLGVTGLHHVSLRVLDLDRSLALYRDTLGFPVKTAFTLDNLRFAMLETGNSGYIELVEVKRAVRPGGEEEVIWHLALRTDDLERSLEAVRKAGYEITVPIRPLDLVNTAAGKPFPIRVAFFRGPDGEDVELLEDRSGQS
ncbi:MAG: VOC family protein [Nitrospiraceae bacterium]